LQKTTYTYKPTQELQLTSKLEFQTMSQTWAFSIDYNPLPSKHSIIHETPKTLLSNLLPTLHLTWKVTPIHSNIVNLITWHSWN
jgi:hypothetical protein